MKKLCTCIVLFLLFIPAFSQKLSKQFGVISKNEFDFTYQEKDPEAEAAILFDLGESYFFETDNGYDIRFTRTKRIKVLSQAGVKYAEISIPFYVDGYGKTEKIKSIEAFTYNLENGLPVKKELDQRTIYEEKINNRWRAKKFAFPEVKEGSIIEYRYILETPFHFNLPDWSFQDRIPTVYSEYTVKMIPFYEYVYLVQGISGFDYHESKPDKTTRTFGSVSEVYGQNIGRGVKFQDMIHVYAMKDVPAFKDESYITSPDDYLMKMDFQLAKFHSPGGGTQEVITTWPELIEGLLEHENFGKYLKKSKRVAKKLLGSSLNIAGKDDLEKSKIIIDFVRSSFSWNGYYGKYTSRSPKEFIEQKTGNSADINLFMIALLNAAAIDAKPVILSTRNHGKIKADYPFDHFFNYVVPLVNAEGKTFLTDGTQNLLDFNKIPLRCINEQGLVIDKQGVNWAGLENKVTSLNSKIIKISIDPEKLSAETGTVIMSTEYEAYGYKRSFNDDTTAIKKHLLKDGFNRISKISTFAFEHNNRPYVIAVEGETTVERIGDKIIISPFLNFPIRENDLKQEKRAYPVDFIYSKSETFKSLIDIPAGFELLAVPEDYQIDNDLAEIHIKFQRSKTGIEVNAGYTFKKAVYYSDEYARIKQYLDTIVKKFNEQLVLEKI